MANCHDQKGKFIVTGMVTIMAQKSIMDKTLMRTILEETRASVYLSYLEITNNHISNSANTFASDFWNETGKHMHLSKYLEYRLENEPRVSIIADLHAKFQTMWFRRGINKSSYSPEEICRKLNQNNTISAWAKKHLTDIEEVKKFEIMINICCTLHLYGELLFLLFYIHSFCECPSVTFFLDQKKAINKQAIIQLVKQCALFRDTLYDEYWKEHSEIVTSVGITGHRGTARIIHEVEKRFSANPFFAVEAAEIFWYGLPETFHLDAYIKPNYKKAAQCYLQATYFGVPSALWSLAQLIKQIAQNILCFEELLFEEDQRTEFDYWTQHILDKFSDRLLSIVNSQTKATDVQTQLLQELESQKSSPLLPLQRKDGWKNWAAWVKRCCLVALYFDEDHFPSYTSLAVIKNKVEGQIDTAKVYYHFSAVHGDRYANYAYAVILRRADTYHCNFKEIITYMKRAADLGYNNARFAMAMYLKKSYAACGETSDYWKKRGQTNDFFNVAYEHEFDKIIREIFIEEISDSNEQSIEAFCKNKSREYLVLNEEETSAWQFLELAYFLYTEESRKLSIDSQILDCLKNVIKRGEQALAWKAYHLFFMWTLTYNSPLMIGLNSQAIINNMTLDYCMFSRNSKIHNAIIANDIKYTNKFLKDKISSCDNPFNDNIKQCIQELEMPRDYRN